MTSGLAWLNDLMLWLGVPQIGQRAMKLNLPTMDEVNAVRRAIPKHQIPTKVDRSKEKLAADKADRKALAKWSKAVRDRDKHVDRFDGKPVLKTFDAHPRRGEAHHIEPRSNWDTRTDVRNGICLAWENHERVEHGDLEVVGTRTFTVAGKKYLDGRYARVVKKQEAK